jgi:RNA polymerase sigma factor (TIGR02999 family)
MTDAHAVTMLLRNLERGQKEAADDLLPLVYGELHRLAQQRMARLPAGQTLQATALVHEAYMKLVGSEDPGWNGRGHFFGAAATAMRDILVDQARKKVALKRGGDRCRVGDAAALAVDVDAPAGSLLDVDDALRQLEAMDARKGRIVMLRIFAGLEIEQIAKALDVSVATVFRDWRFARSWLSGRLLEHNDGPGDSPGLADTD